MAQDWRDALSFEPVGAHGQNASLSSAATITIPDGAGKVLVQALAQNIRITLDGTTPTASKGFQLYAGDPAVIFPLGAGSSLKAIEEAATATLEYQFAR